MRTKEQHAEQEREYYKRNKEKIAERSKKHYQDKKDEWRERHRANSRQRSLEWEIKKMSLILSRGGECSICGYELTLSNSPSFEFHHRDPKTKKYCLTKEHLNDETLEKEFDKCDVVCANCHRALHFRRFV